MSKKYLKICPKCGSTKVESPPESLSGIIPEQDYCNDCYNRGNFPEVEESKVGEFKRLLKKRT